MPVSMVFTAMLPLDNHTLLNKLFVQMDIGHWFVSDALLNRAML